MNLAFGPGKRACGLVVVGDEALDVSFELIDGLEGCTIERLSAEDREPDLDLVERSLPGAPLSVAQWGVRP